jgi:PTH1 family peptidyl-tRNA hydrolase
VERRVSSASPRIVFGLGNPGREHAGTRHNTGVELLEHLARHEGLLFQPADALEGYAGPRSFRWARSDDPRAFLVRAEVPMNRCGEVLPALLGRLDAQTPFDPARLLVIYDDLDLPIGMLRIRPGGGAGGHNGMRSVISTLGTESFARLRVGIGRPRTDAARHVLARFLPEERAVIDAVLGLAARAVELWLATGDIEQCLARFHSRHEPRALPGALRAQGQAPRNLRRGAD